MLVEQISTCNHAENALNQSFENPAIIYFFCQWILELVTESRHEHKSQKMAEIETFRIRYCLIISNLLHSKYSVQLCLFNFLIFFNRLFDSWYDIFSYIIHYVMETDEFKRVSHY